MPTKTAINLCSVLGLIGCAFFIFYGFQHQLFTSEEALQAYIGGFGALGALVFVFFQVIQVVVPILPGGLGCLAGVLLFGPVNGFFYNYIGICLGSILAFLLARTYGKSLLNSLFQQKTIQKYEAWTNRNFARWFAVAIFFPVAPDDFLCYLAGTTDLSLKKFSAIILLGKPASIALYSLGLTVAFQRMAAMFH